LVRSWELLGERAQARVNDGAGLGWGRRTDLVAASQVTAAWPGTRRSIFGAVTGDQIAERQTVAAQRAVELVERSGDRAGEVVVAGPDRDVDGAVAQGHRDHHPLVFVLDHDPGVRESGAHARERGERPGIDERADGQITVGRGKDCYKYPFALPILVKAEAVARAGAGPIAIQVYSKGQ
jgi:hypothetical protein